MFYPLQKKVFIIPVISHSTYYRHKSSLAGAASHLKKKKKKAQLCFPAKAQLKCTWMLAASAQPDAARCTTGRNRERLLRRGGQTLNHGMGQATTRVKEILLCMPQRLCLYQKTRVQSNVSGFSVSRLRAATFS